MGKQSIVRITTHDTEKVYELPGQDLPQLWVVGLGIARVRSDGNHNVPYPTKQIYLEQKTLEAAGLVPKSAETKKSCPDNVETAEDLILRLLELVEVYPVEES